MTRQTDLTFPQLDSPYAAYSRKSVITAELQGLGNERLFRVLCTDDLSELNDHEYRLRAEYDVADAIVKDYESNRRRTRAATNRGAPDAFLKAASPMEAALLAAGVM